MYIAHQNSNFEIKPLFFSVYKILLSRLHCKLFKIKVNNLTWVDNKLAVRFSILELLFFTVSTYLVKKYVIYFRFEI